MGATISHYPSTPTDYPVFSLTIRAWDKIKIIDGNAAVIGIVRETLHTHYGKIQAETIGNDGGTCFKLAGWPFSKTNGTGLSITTKNFFTQLMMELYRNGWKLWLNSDLSRTYDFSTLFFRRCPVPSTNFSICCLSLSSYDKFQLINAPDTLYQALLECVGNLVQNQSNYTNCKEVKMYGYMWYNHSYEQSNIARMLLLKIFKSFRQYGFTYFGTVNLKGTADSIFFINEHRHLPPEDYCVISLNSKDRLRLINCPKTLIDMAHEVILNKWPGGLQNVRNDGECVEYKMKGYPWYANYRADAVNSRIFITQILEESVKRGWAVLTSLDVSRKVDDKAVFIMRSCSPMHIPHFCITPASTDEIRVIGANPVMREMLLNLIRTCWTPGVQRESDGGVDYELKLRGFPWHCSSFTDSFALARIMMTRILTALESHGWSVICSADVSAKFISNSSGNNSASNDTYPCDVHSWFVAQTSLISNAAGPSTSSFAAANGDAPPSYKEALM